jgi:hypothetical protein
MTLSADAERTRMRDDFVRTVSRISAAIDSVIEGKAEVIRLILTVLLAEGVRHIRRGVGELQAGAVIWKC